MVLGFAALVAGLAAWWLKPSPSGPRPEPIDVTRSEAAAPAVDESGPPPPVGGVYAGTVVDKDDRPVAGADVLLAGPADHTIRIASPNLPSRLEESQGGAFDVSTVGNVGTVARTKTDAEGHFRAAAGSNAVLLIVAFDRAHAPGLLSHTKEEPLEPSNDIVVRLPDPGWLKGLVVDASTKAPVRDADVRVYLQARANQTSAGPEPLTARNAWARYQEFVSRELGPAIWGVTPEAGDASLRLASDSAGRFMIGPLMSEVQVEVAITHPDYAWSDFDPEVMFPGDNPKEGDRDYKPGREVRGRIRRLVIPPGETVEKTYALEKGKEVRGVVKDDRDQPLADVTVSVEHVAQYKQHYWYRFKPRVGKTDQDGRFRVAGLSYPPYNLKMEHPAFSTEWFHGVAATTDDSYSQKYVISAEGWLEAEVVDGPEIPLYQATLALQAQPTPDRSPVDRIEHVQVQHRKFTVERLKPGRYLAALTAGTYVSPVVPIEVAPRVASTVSLRLSTGGETSVSVADRNGVPVDPANVEFVLLGPDGGQRVGSVTTREGLAIGTALRPGQYRVRVRASEFLEAYSDPFQVAEGRRTSVGPVVLRRSGYVKITGVRDEEGRTPALDTDIYVSEGDEPYQKRIVHNGLMLVKPGRVRLKAQSGDKKFEVELQVDDAQTVPVDVVVSK
jgi:hypothetical protein